jgi:hypothetical protein
MQLARSAITGRLAENSQEAAACGVRLVVMPVSLRPWSMFEESTHVGEHASRFSAQADCDVQADGRQQHGRLGTPLSLMKASKRAGSK